MGALRGFMDLDDGARQVIALRSWMRVVGEGCHVILMCPVNQTNGLGTATNTATENRIIFHPRLPLSGTEPSKCILHA